MENNVMTQEQFDQLVGKVNESAKESIKTQVAEQTAAMKKDFDEKQKQLETELAAAKKKTEEAEQKANQALEGHNEGSFKTFRQRVRKALEENKEKFKEILDKRSGTVEFTVKDTLTSDNTLPVAASATFAAQGVQTAYELPQVLPFVFDFVDDGQTDSVAIPYVDEIAHTGDAAFIGEGVVKPLIDINTETRISSAKKVAGKVKTSEEALLDLPFMEGLILGKLRRRHDIALQAGILNGDGTGANLAGIIPKAAAFAAGALAASVDNATNYDAIAAAYNQILVTSDGNYMPNAVFAHPSDIMLMRLSKDANNNYIMPPFSGPNGDTVLGLTVVPSTAMTAGSYLIGDFSKAMLRRYVDFSIRVGYGISADGNTSDFEQNLLTMLGESRVHLIISENESAAFVTGTFAAAKTALETA